MSSHIASRFGVAGGTIALLALAASGYAMSLPYRISPTQMSLLGVAHLVQFVGSPLSLLLGVVALWGDRRSQWFGYAAIALGGVALLLAFFFTPFAHSTSRW